MLNQSKGFNLVEMIVVLTIIAVLTIAGFGYYRSSVAETQINGIFTIAADHVNRIQSFYMQKKSYPSLLADVGISSDLVTAANPNISKVVWNNGIPPRILYEVDTKRIGLDSTVPFTVAFVFGSVDNFVAAGCNLCGNSKFLPYLPPECVQVSTKGDCS
jgi:prepilin-type N-terminal cleavage/methylation domain-containing protein